MSQKAPGVQLIRPIKREIAHEDWSDGATLNIGLRKDQVVSRYLVWIRTATAATAATLGMIRALRTVTLLDADGNPIKTGRGFMHSLYNKHYNGRGVRPVGDINVASGAAPQYGLLELRFELFDGDTRFLFPAFAMHDLQLQIICEALATIDTHTTTTFDADIYIWEEGYLKSSFDKAFLARETWHTIINRQKVHDFTSAGDDQRLDLWRGTHMRRLFVLQDETANTFLRANCTLTSCGRIRTYRNGTLITDEWPEIMYHRDVMDYGKSLTSEAIEAGRIIATTVIDDHICCVVNYDMAEGDLKSVLNLVGADSYEISFDIDTPCKILIFSEEIV